MSSKRKLHCPFCDAYFYDTGDLASHLESEHFDSLPQGVGGWQYCYFLRTGHLNGKCRICKKDTKWNEKRRRPEAFCDNPKCREAYVKIFENRMIDKYGKARLLDDPEQQKKMLENRKITEKYVWQDHYHVSICTGKNEVSFVSFCESLGFSPTDVIMPSPHTYYYEYEGKKHFYIPDVFIASLNVEIEIKDGGDNPNMHPKIQAVDKVKEKLKDEVMKGSSFHYLKIYNKENERLFEFLERLKENELSEYKKKIYMI